MNNPPFQNPKPNSMNSTFPAEIPAQQVAFDSDMPPPPPPSQTDATPALRGFAAGAHDNADFSDFGITEDPEIAFPMECLPAPLGNVIQEVSRSLRVPQELVAANAIGVLSAAIGAGLEIETYVGPLRGNLFILGVAASGIGKGLLSKALHEPLHAYEAAWRSYWRATDLPKAQAAKRSLESRLRVLEKESGKTTDIEERTKIQNEMSKLELQLKTATAAMTEPQMIVGDITREKLAIALSHGWKECLASISSEARGIINVLCGRYNSMSDEDIYLAAFSGDPCRIDRVNRPSVQLSRPCLTLIWLFQPDKLDEMLENPSLMESGFLPRCLMVPSEAKIQPVPEQPPKMNQSTMQSWRELVFSVADAFYFQQPQVVQVDPMAAKLVRDFDNSIREEINNGQTYPGIESFCRRWVENLWRLMLVLHVARHGPAAAQHSITAQDAEKAITLMKWFIQQQLDILSSVQEQKTNKRLNQLLTILSTQQSGESTLRDMKRRHGFSQEELKRLCTQHPDKIRIEQAPQNGPGRPSVLIRLVPGAA